jgi:hypothetical protein
MAHRELNDALGFTPSVAELLADARTGKNQKPFSPTIRHGREGPRE